MGSISIVIATLNRPALLLEAMDSALRQSRTPLEVIVVDDGSTHPANEGDLQGRFGSTVRVLRNNVSHGLAWARNQGVESSKGDYVVHLDDDDLFAPTLLSEGATLLDNDPELELVFLGVKGFGTSSEHFNRVHPLGTAKVIEQGGGLRVGDGVYKFDSDLPRGLLQQVPMPFQRVMSRREVWRKVHELRLASYQRALGLGSSEEAWEMIRGTLRDSEWARYAAFACRKLALVDRPLYRQRCDGQGGSSQPAMRLTHVSQAVKIRSVMLKAASHMDEIRPFRDAIRSQLARGQFDAAFQFMNEGQCRTALGHLYESFRLQPQLRHLKLLARLSILSLQLRRRSGTA